MRPLVPRPTTAVVATLATVGLAVAACGGGTDPIASTPTHGTTSGHPSPSKQPAATEAALERPGASCLRASDHATLVRFGARRSLGGYLVGSGDRYVVLAHELGGDSCQMIELARLLAREGFHTFAFDGAGVASSRPGPLEGHQVADDVLAAVAFARENGATSVALVGASKGGYGVLDAALRARPAVDAVVSLSAPSAWDDPRGRLLDISALRTPTQLWASRQDAGFFEAARGFARQDDAAELHLEPGAAHGVALVPVAFGRIKGFLDAHLR